MDSLIEKLTLDFPGISFRDGDTFRWSPKHQQITYRAGGTHKSDLWALLHELGHATLGHFGYSSDFELLSLEVAAWEKARELAAKYGHSINSEHIQGCLDTYREWLHRRSTCPTCGNRSLQHTSTQYRCFNCHTAWRVTASRFCRPYRQLLAPESEEPSALSEQTTFI